MSSKPTARRNLILLRAGDDSLHGSWLEDSRSERNWDLHISYYGSAGAPRPLAADGVTWTADHNPSKWSGVKQALASGRFSLDDYDYVAVPDDDLVTSAEQWDRAFDIARKYDLAACQLSLLHDSFFSWPETLHRPFLELRFVSMIEMMAPIIRVDVFKRLIGYFDLEDNLWGMGHLLADLLREQHRATAVIDAATVLHSRAFTTGPLYKPILASGRRLADIRDDFLKSHSLTKAPRITFGAVTLGGVHIDGRGWLSNLLFNGRTPLLLWPHWLNRYRRRTGLLRIAQSQDGAVVLARRFRGAPRLPVDRRKALLRRPDAHPLGKRGVAILYALAVTAIMAVSMSMSVRVAGPRLSAHLVHANGAACHQWRWDAIACWRAH